MNKNSSGFTLIELLVVIAIIGILAAIVGVSLSSTRLRARDARRITDFRTLTELIDVYKLNYNKLPDNPATTDSDAGGFDVGNIARGHTFLEPLQDAGLTSKPIVDLDSTFNSAISYRYRKYGNDAVCGGTFAILAVKLEQTQDTYHIDDSVESCYAGIVPELTVSNDQWITWMVRE